MCVQFMKKYWNKLWGREEVRIHQNYDWENIIPSFYFINTTQGYFIMFYNVICY